MQIRMHKLRTQPRLLPPYFLDNGLHGLLRRGELRCTHEGSRVFLHQLAERARRRWLSCSQGSRLSCQLSCREDETEDESNPPPGCAAHGVTKKANRKSAR